MHEAVTVALGLLETEAFLARALPACSLFPFFLSGLGLLRRRDRKKRTSPGKTELSVALFDNLAVPVLVIEPPGETILAANPAAVEFYGYGSDTIAGMSLKNLEEAEPAGPDSGRGYRRHRLASGDIRDVEVEEAGFELDGRHLRYMMIKDATQKRMSELELKLEIDERRTMEEALLISEERYTDLFDYAPVSLWEFDFCRLGGCLEKGEDVRPDMIVLEDINESTVALLAASSKEEVMASAPPLLFDGPEGQELFLGTMEAFADGRRTFETKATLRSLDGRRITCLVKLYASISGGRWLGRVMAAVVDLSERHRMEQELREALADKELLMKEIHHRVKNNLMVIQSLLSLQSHQLEEGRAQEVLLESRGRVRAMSLIHEKLYHAEDLRNIPLSEYIRNLMVELFQNYEVNAHNVRLEMEIDDLSFDVETLAPCALILNELVTNALKYAFPENSPGFLYIFFRKTGPADYELVVGDDGRGVPENLLLGSEGGTDGGFGLQVVDSLVRQLGGSMEFRRQGPTGGRGSTFTIRFSERSFPEAPEAV